MAPRPERRVTWRRHLKPVIGIAVAALFLWLLLHGLDMVALRRAFAEISLPFLALALALLAVGYGLRIIRWWWMLRALEPGLPLRACVWPFLTSIAVNNVMPIRAGDALRVFGFRRQLRSPAMRVLGTLLIERTLDLLVLLGFFFVGLWGLRSGAFPERFVTIAIWLFGFGLAAVFVLVVFTPRLLPLVRRLARLPILVRGDLSQAVLTQGEHLVGAFGLLRAPSRLAALLALSLAAWAFEGAVFVTVAAALGAEVEPLGPWFSFASGTLSTLIPSAPGYVGTFDYFVAKAFEAYGADPVASVAFALTIHTILWAPLTALGLLYLGLRGTRFWDLRSAPAANLSKDYP